MCKKKRERRQFSHDNWKTYAKGCESLDECYLVNTVHRHIVQLHTIILVCFQPSEAFLCFLVLEKTLESPLDCKKIQPVHSGGLACCDSRSRKETDTTERLNWTELSPVNYFWLINLSPWGQLTSFIKVWIFFLNLFSSQCIHLFFSLWT